MNEWGQEIKRLFKKIKTLSKIKKTLLILVIVIVLAGCFWTYTIMQLAQYYDTNKQTIDDSLTFSSQENYKQAYGLFADKYKKEENFETFKKNILTARPAYLDYIPHSFHITRTTIFFYPINPLTIRYIGDISYKNGDKATVTALFISENNIWKLYLLEFNSPNPRLDNIN